MKIELYNWVNNEPISNGIATILYDRIIFLKTKGNPQGQRLINSSYKNEIKEISREVSVEYNLIEISKGDKKRRLHNISHQIESVGLKGLTSNEYFTRISFFRRLIIKWWNKDFYIQKKEFSARMIDWIIGGIVGAIIATIVKTYF